VDGFYERPPDSLDVFQETFPAMLTSSPGPDRSASTVARGESPLDPDRYGVLGVEIALETDSADLRSFFRTAYAWFPPSGSRVDLELTAALDPRSPGGPFASAAGRKIPLGGSSSPANRAFLFLLESLMDRIDGSICLHGAAVAANAGGVILAGPALAGKSTLVLELMRIGYTFMSDDAAPIERSTGRLLPFPRAVGIRKGSGTEADILRTVAPAGRLELPHKWLVNPSALGAVLPVAACRPAFLFYLDSADAAAQRGTGTYELALADAGADVRRELTLAGASTVEDADGRPFPTLVVAFQPGSGAASKLASLWRRRRESILYIEEVRPRPARTSEKPVITETGAAALLLPLVRDVLNRGESGRLMSAHEGRLSSLVAELGGHLGNVRCFRAVSGTPRATAEAIAEVIDGKGDLP
jgi:hypothetical protein